MLHIAENSVLNALLFISLFLPVLVLVVKCSRLVDHRTKTTKERVPSHAPTPRKTISTTTSPNRKPTTPPPPCRILTVAEALGFSIHEHDETQNDLDPSHPTPGPARSLTVGEALGLVGKKKDRKDKKKACKWRVALINALSKIAVLSSCGGCQASMRGRGGKPLSSLMKEMDRAEKTRKEELAGPMGEVGKDPSKGENECRVCRVRSTDAAFVPCGHTYCRVCSREIWINRRSCPVCRCGIVEVLDSF